MLKLMELALLQRDELLREPSANDDPHVERALDAMRQDPKRRWTVAELARVAGLSRSAFARRFTLAMKRGPLHWLADLRLALAQQMLLDTDAALAGVATEIGYECEFAFAKAFKRRFGVAPGMYRRRSIRAAA